MNKVTNIQNSTLRRAAALALTLVATLFYGTQVWADITQNLANGSVGICMYVNGVEKWYTQYSNPASGVCSAVGYDFNSAPSINGVNFGYVSSFQLRGVGALGWVGDKDTDWIAGIVYYVIDPADPSNINWSGETHKGNYDFGNYWHCDLGSAHVRCSWNDYCKQLGGYKYEGGNVGFINLLDGLTAGSHTIYFKSEARLQYKKDQSAWFYGTQAHDGSQVVSATFIVPEHPTEVALADQAEVLDGPGVELSMYYRFTGCIPGIKEYGFVYCNTNNCTPSLGSDSTVKITSKTSLEAKKVYTKKFYQNDNGKALAENTTYRYRAYVRNPDSSDPPVYSEVGTFRTGSTCRYAVSDTIYYTIDNTQAEDPCELRFKTLAHAVADLKKDHRDMSGATIDAWLDDDSGSDTYRCLTAPVVFEVVNSIYGDTSGDSDDPGSDRDECLENINTKSLSTFTPTPDVPQYQLVIRAKDPVSKSEDKPLFKGGLSLLGARNIKLENIRLSRSTTESSHSGAALELGIYLKNNQGYDDDAAMNECLPGAFANTDIELKGCEIDATAFNSIHAAACNGLKINGCVFNMHKPDYPTADGRNNARDWGASVKLMSCKNVEFTQNSLEGSHASTLFLQYVQNMLIMNNVFWNANQYTQNVAFVRPVVLNFTNYTPPANNEHIGVYYNTFYLAEDNTSGSYNVDFLKFGCYDAVYGCDDNGQNCGVSYYSQKGNNSYYDHATIQFKWNNCYSYDASISSRSAKAFQDIASLTDGNYTSNNFWSKGDVAPTDESANSNLRFGTDTKHIDVEAQVCKSTAEDPDDLVLNGVKLNIGVKPTTDISSLDVATNTYADRFTGLIRPEEGTKWSYGAFQQAIIAEIDTIVWTGERDGDWDNRANWKTPSGRKINCANQFSSNLHVIIPDASEVKNIPNIPAWNGGERGTYPAESVSAGLGSVTYDKTSKFADSFILQEGAAIMGIENLREGGTMHYSSAANSLTAIRDEWVLVGAVIKNFDTDTDPYNTSTVRDIRSEDFYLKHEPHVYMQQFEESGGSIIPGTPFTDLKTTVDASTAFGIYIPDQYGPLKLPASRYYSKYDKKQDMLEDKDRPKKFDFKGHFANESEMPKYVLSVANKWYFVNNSYTANLNVTQLLKDNTSIGLCAYVYEYGDRKDWKPVTSASADTYVTPFSGFVLYSTSVPANACQCVQTTSTQYGSGTTLPPYLRRASANTNLELEVINSADATASSVQIFYEFITMPKAFSYNASTPELYIPDGDNKYSVYSLNDLSTVIPLGVRNKQASGNLSVQFKLVNMDGFESVVLEDRLHNNTYNLTDGVAPYFNGITPGDCEGRFYLNINYAGDDISDIPTKVDEDDVLAESAIGIFASENVLTVSVPVNMVIESITLYDMAGRITRVPLSGSNIVKSKLNVSDGVYTVKVVTDKATETKKVIIK